MFVSNMILYGTQVYIKDIGKYISNINNTSNNTNIYIYI